MPGLIVWGDDKRAVRLSGVFLSYLVETLITVLDLMHSSLPVQIADRFVDFPAGESLDRFFERWVSLPDDLVEMGCPHSGSLQLMVGSACLDCFMLAHIANEQHSVVRLQSTQEFIDLASAGETRFV